MMGYTGNEALEAAAAAGEAYAKLIGSAEYDIGIYRPHKVDPQEPHLRDEIYIVLRGTGAFICGNERRPFGPGDLLHVPAGTEHRFLDFSDDFATWVVFFGSPKRA